MDSKAAVKRSSPKPHLLSRILMAALRLFLVFLDKLFALTRKKVVPLYPYEKSTDTIRLPAKVDRELRGLIAMGNNVEAVRRVTTLTGAGLRLSKNYVDTLAHSVNSRRQR